MAARRGGGAAGGGAPAGRRPRHQGLLQLLQLQVPPSPSLPTRLSCRVYEEASQAAECKEEEAFCYVSQPQPNLALEKPKIQDLRRSLSMRMLLYPTKSRKPLLSLSTSESSAGAFAK